ncbi:MAG TPA: HD domain-containing protein [Clostridiales bacterium]|jgi:putative nucleotidyltransferase with HDIG domain|nr:HD domain-containing protein [Clostridiales bacterium]
MNTQKILTSQAIPGMIVAEDVYTKDLHLIIGKDTVLTDKIITRLEFYSITDISVYSNNNFIHIENEYIENTFYSEIKKSASFKLFRKAYQNTVNHVKDSIDNIALKKQDVNPEQLLYDVNKILYQCKTNIELFNMLHCMREYDDTTYIHSLNVSLICNIMGKWLNFNSEDLEVVTLCGLLHDVGKLLVPNNIITKPERLTNEEFSLIKTHVIRGYNLLRDKNIDERIKNTALMHHERCDGSGYPNGLISHEIDSFAKLVAIADVYDAMTCARVYRGPLCPFEVIHLFETEGYLKYDTKYILTFLEGIVQTYINNNVRLNNNMEGEIVMINKLSLSRPVIKVRDEFIDLSKHRDLYIQALI